MKERNLLALILVLALALFAAIVVWPDNPNRYLPGGFWPSGNGIKLGTFERREMRLGLDLKGGTYIVLRADRTKLPEGTDLGTTLDGAVDVIERRVNSFGVAETEVQRQGEDQIQVQIPSITADAAVRLIGSTAQLEFREPKMGPGGQPEQDPTTGDLVWIPATGTLDNGTERQLTGRDLKTNTRIGTDQIGRPTVEFELNSEGAQLMGQITGRLVAAGNLPLAIFVDNQLISSPQVQGQITDRGQITGVSADEAKTLVAQLNAGALPVPLDVVQVQQVDATLGSDSVRKSVIAGEVGFAAVAIFMILYYRLAGATAVAALTVYTLLTLATFKLWPVTLTLAGIAAFVLSVGMAVDANILIFERTREEMRVGRTLRAAMDAGFGRAWTSIRDSNVSTLITCAILYWFGDQFGAALVKGFALTLAIGVAISMFSAIFVTRVFLHAIIGTRLGRRHWLFAGGAADLPHTAPAAEEATS